MALEVAGVVLDKLIRVEADEGASFVRHRVPGLAGDLSQALGRPSVRIRIEGIFYGATAADDMGTLRGHLLAREPVDFLCELTGQGYFTQVLVDRLNVVQRAGRPDEFGFECTLVEYVPPPPPPAGSPFGDLDAGLLAEAAGFIDDVQNALAAVSDIAGLLAGAADFGNPTTRLPAMLDGFGDAAGGAPAALAAIGDLL